MSANLPPCDGSSPSSSQSNQLSLALLLAGNPFHSSGSWLTKNALWYHSFVNNKELRVQALADCVHSVIRVGMEPALFVYGENAAAWSPMLSAVPNTTTAMVSSGSQCSFYALPTHARALQWRNLACALELMTAHEKQRCRSYDYAARLRTDFPMQLSAHTARLLALPSERPRLLYGWTMSLIPGKPATLRQSMPSICLSARGYTLGQVMENTFMGTADLMRSLIGGMRPVFTAYEQNLAALLIRSRASWVPFDLHLPSSIHPLLVQQAANITNDHPSLSLFHTAHVPLVLTNATGSYCRFNGTIHLACSTIWTAKSCRKCQTERDFVFPVPLPEINPKCTSVVPADLRAAATRATASPPLPPPPEAR